MHADIVMRLRTSPWLKGSPTGDMLLEAADEIERLRKDLHHVNEYALELRYKLDLANHELRRYET